MRSTCWRRSPRTRPSCATATGPTCSATARSRPGRSAAICSICTASRRRSTRFSDPLCDALQVLNHLQDCQDDYRALDRVYLPLDRFAAAGIGVEELDRPRASPALRRVLDDTLAGVDQLLRAAADLPRALRSRRLAAESAVILAIARRLAARAAAARSAGRAGRARPRGVAALRPAGPRPAAAAAAAPVGSRRCRRCRDDRAAAAHGAGRPDLEPAPRGRTSRRWSRPRARRSTGACACCRAPSATRCTRSTPSAARSTTSPTATRRRAAKLAAAGGWRAEIAALFAGRPSRPTTLALAQPVARFELPRAEFDAMIDGMEMDAGERMRAPPLAELERYCRCVAGAVGLLSVRVFGARGAAARAGRAGARRGAAAHQHPARSRRGRRRAAGSICRASCSSSTASPRRDPDRVLRHPALPEVCGALAERARQRFADAERLLRRAATGGSCGRRW